MRVCKSCGHPLINDLIPELKLTGMQKRILEIVNRRSPTGISMQELASAVYADDPDGGPLNAGSSLRSTVFQLNRKLKPHGLRVYGKIGRASDGYRIVQLTGESSWHEMWSKPFHKPEYL